MVVVKKSPALGRCETSLLSIEAGINSGLTPPTSCNINMDTRKVHESYYERIISFCFASK